MYTGVIEMFVQIDNDSEPGETKLTLPEEIRIANAEQFKQDLIVAVEGERVISIDGSKVSRIDTAAIQLLTALSHECNEKGHPIKWNAASEKLVNYVKLLGLRESLGLQDL